MKPPRRTPPGLASLPVLLALLAAAPSPAPAQDITSPTLSGLLAAPDPFTPPLQELLIEYRVDEAANAAVEIRDAGDQLVRSYPGRYVQPATTHLSQVSEMQPPYGVNPSAGALARGGVLYFTGSSSLYVADVDGMRGDVVTDVNFIEKIAIAGSRVFVVGTSDGGVDGRLAVVDVSNPAAPSQVSVLSVPDVSFRALQVTSDGRHLFAAGSGQMDPEIFLSFDLTGPEPFLMVRSTNFPSALSMRLSGDTLVAAHEDQVLRLYDVSAPNAAPVLLGELAVPGLAMNSSTELGLSPDGNFVYGALRDPDTNEGKLAVIDISAPDAPMVAASRTEAELGVVPGDLGDDVLAHGHFLYIRSEYTPGVQGVNIVDVLDPLNPTYVGKGNFSVPQKLAATGNTLFILSSYNATATAFMLSPAASDRVAWDGRDAGGAQVPPGSYAYTVTAVDMAGNTSQAAGTVQLAEMPPDITSPTISGLLAAPDPFTPPLQELLIEYRVDEAASATVEIRDTGNQLVRSYPGRYVQPDLTHVSRVSEIQPPFTGGAMFAGALAKDGILYFAGTSSLYIADVEGMRGEVVTDVNVIEKLAIAGSRVFVVGTSDGGVDGRLAVVDVSNPSAPSQVSVLSVPDASFRTLQVTHDGRRLLAVGSGQTDPEIFLSFDLTGPEPFLAVRSTGFPSAWSMRLSGDTLAVVHDDQVLRLYDVSAATAAPRLLGELAVPGLRTEFGAELGFSPDGRFVYGASLDPDTSEGKLVVVDISVPESPVLAASRTEAELGIGGLGSDILAHGRFLYIPAGDYIDIIDVSDPLNPTYVGHENSLSSVKIVAMRNTLFGLEPYNVTVFALSTAGSDRVAWDGRDAGGAQAPPGNYAYIVTAVDMAGNTSQEAGAITLASPPDAVAPAAVADLSASPGLSTSAAAVVLSWTAPGDDGGSGPISGGQLDLRYSSTTAGYAAMEGQVLMSTDASPGEARALAVEGLARGTTYYFALRYADEAGNFSAVSNLASTRTFEALSSGGFAVTTTTILIEAPQAATLSITPMEFASLTSTAQFALTDAGLGLVGAVFDVLPEGTVFSPPALFTMSWQDANGDGLEDTTGVDESLIVLRKFHNAAWEDVVPVVSRDLAANRITVEVSLLASLFALTVPRSSQGAPVALLDFPGALGLGVEAAVGGVVDVRGSVSNASAWTLEAAPGQSASSGFTTIASGAGDVSGHIASWDTASLSGYQTLRLRATQAQGNAATAAATVFVGKPVFAFSIGRKDSDVIVNRLKNPTGIAVRSDGLIWVAGGEEGGLLLLTSSGAVVNSVGGVRGHGRGGGRGQGRGHDDDDNEDERGFEGVRGLALDAADNLYVADRESDRVVKLSPDGSAILLALGKVDKHGKTKPGSGPGEFRKPWDVAVDANGDIFVADSGNRRIQVFDSSGTFLRQFGSDVLLSTSELRGIALTSEGLWVSDKEQEVIHLFSRSGSLIKTISGADSAVGELSRMRGLASDRLGALYVVEPNRDQVQKFDPRGRGLLAFGSKAGLAHADKKDKRYLTEPVDAALAPDGSLWVADTGRDRIVRYALPTAGGYGVAASPAGGSSSGAAEPARRLVDHKDGAKVERDDGTGVDVPKGALAADIEITVDKADEAKDAEEKAAKRREKKVKPVSEEVEYGPEGTRFDKPVTLTLAYEPAPGLDEKSLKVHYWNPSSKDWEALDSVVDEKARTVSAQTTHFSVYQVQGSGSGIGVSAAVDEFGLRDAYAFPNPSRSGSAVTFRVQPGLADSVEVRVYDLSGRKVHSSSNFRFLGAFDDGNAKGAQNTYDHVWDVSGIGSGVYHYVIVAKKAGQADIRKTGKTAVIR